MKITTPQFTVAPLALGLCLRLLLLPSSVTASTVLSTNEIAASPALAGKSIYITDDAGYMHIIEPGPRFNEFGRNIIENIHLSGQGGNPGKQESFYTSPFFEGKAMYLRGEEYLYCIREE